jgi:hypothetical protein
LKMTYLFCCLGDGLTRPDCHPKESAARDHARKTHRSR